MLPACKATNCDKEQLCDLFLSLGLLVNKPYENLYMYEKNNMLFCFSVSSVYALNISSFI